MSLSTVSAQVLPEFDGWFRNPDGTATIIAGYTNKSDVEISLPVGEGNRLTPGEPDRGQPTRFPPGRHRAVFTVHLLKDEPLQWTLNGLGVTLKLDPLWTTNVYHDRAGNTPPYVSFDPAFIGVQGPPIGHSKAYTAAAGKPLELTVWIADDGKTGMQGTPALDLRWFMYRGPMAAVFASERPLIEARPAPDGLKLAGTAKATATFPKPGEYWLALAASDGSGDGDGGFACCWTTVQVRVDVR